LNPKFFCNFREIGSDALKNLSVIRTRTNTFSPSVEVKIGIVENKLIERFFNDSPVIFKYGISNFLPHRIIGT